MHPADGLLAGALAQGDARDDCDAHDGQQGKRDPNPEQERAFVGQRKTIVGFVLLGCVLVGHRVWVPVITKKQGRVQALCFM